MHGDLPSIVPRRNYDIRTQCLKGTCSSSELPGRWHVSLFLDAACPCRGCSSMFFRKRPHGKDGCESHCRIRSIVLVFRIERMTGFEPAISCLGSRRAATAPHPHCRVFSDTSHGGDVLSAGRKRMAGFRVDALGITPREKVWIPSSSNALRPFLPVVTDVLIPLAGNAGHTA